MVYPLSSTTPGETGVPASPSFPSIEQTVLKYWDQDGTFRASIAERPAADDGHTNEFVFYDGPPFANGLPHYGHLLTGYVKDIVPRYQTMLGHRVDRRFGWDTHGLPAELEAMKQLGLTEKREIEAMGVDKFNAACRSSVLKYTKEWREYVTRQARWVDFDNDYKSLDPTFMESVLWAFSQLWHKGLAYEGFRVLPYCWKDQTPLSNHELRMDDDVYQPRQDQTVTVTFPLYGPKAEELGLDGVQAIGWTTTPWTMPSNEAIAVGPDIDYVVVPATEAGSLPGRFLLARALVGQYAKDLGYESAEAVEAAVEERHFAGAELEGIAYERLFDYFADTETYGTGNAWKIVLADYVDTTEGTGIVHQAPAYGEDDQKTCEAYGIPVIVTVDEGATFLPTVTDFAGLQVFEANRPIIRTVRERGRLLREASYEHSYPHCWRCRTPLIYKAVSSWFVRVTAIKDRMLELNQQIDWVPGHIKDGQFGKWLEGARDWSISRNRYWGSPIPVWKSDDPAYPRVDVYGSLAQLEADFGRLPRDEKGEVNLHRPYIDELTRPNPDDPTGRSAMRRIPDVLDVWFDSGSMPYAQVHYPFENQDWFDHHHPADFIVEYIGQTRGWFYLLHVLSTALFDRPAFRTVVCHGIVLGNDGRKMSKSLRNYPDVNEVFDTYGSDAMRWYLMSSPVVTGGNLVVTGEGIRDGVRQTIIPLWNAWHFFSLYANLADDGAGHTAHRVTDPADVLDRYVLAKLGGLTVRMRDRLDRFDIPGACAELRDFVDVLNNWYIRRSRARFWAGEHAALDTLHTVLETLTRLAAPLLPLVTEEIWRGLTGGRSVHLADYPDPAEFAAADPDGSLVASMDRVREVCSAALGVRKAHGLRARQPLSALTVVAGDAGTLGAFTGLVTDEVNVRGLGLLPLDQASEERFGLAQRLTVHARVAGPRLGKAVQQAIRGAKSGDWSAAGGTVTAGGVALVEGEYALETVASGAAEGEAVAALPGGGFVVLDTRLTPELEAEGLARDVIRAVQQARKDAGLQLADRVRLRLGAGTDVRAAVEANRELVMRETGTVGLEFADLGGTAGQGGGAVTVGDGSSIDVQVVRA